MAKDMSRRKQILTIVLVLVVLMGLCSASVAIYAKSAITEGTVELPQEPVPSKTAVPDKNGFTAYLADVLVANTYNSNRVKTNLSTNVSIDRDSVQIEGNDANADVVKYIVSSLAGKIGESYPSHEGEFGDEFNLFPAVSLNADDISEFEFRQGEVNPDDEATANEPDYYYFTAETAEFNIIDNAAISQHGFPYCTAADLKPAIYKVTDSLAEMLDVTACEIKATGSKVDGKTNRLTDQLQYINLLTNYSVKLDVNFKGDYAALGKAVISFNMNTEEKYSYTWAGVEITEDEITLKLNEEEALPLNVTLSDKAMKGDYVISFESSDPSAASVDADGNVKGLSISDKPVTVKVTFEYLGETYTDSCSVYVINQVEKIKTQPEKATLKIGDTQKLSVEFKPEDATIQNVLWFTEDEEIASVANDGTVTALKEGTVKVYAVSVDGNFRSSCVVTVTGGEK